MTLVSRPEQPADLKVCCGDHGTNDGDVQRLRDLMAGGMSQPDASRVVWGGVPDLPEPGNAAGWVRRTLAARVGWLRLGGAA